MRAVTRYLYSLARVFAALAAVFLFFRYGAPARRMRTFLLLYISHDDLPFISN